MSELETPLSNVEAIIQNGLGASNTVVPMSRVENLLAELITAVGSSGSSFMATFTVDNTTYSCDKTLSEIKAAAATGPVIGIFESNSGVRIFYLAHLFEEYVEFDHITYSYDSGLDTITISFERFEVSASATYYDQHTYALN